MNTEAACVLPTVEMGGQVPASTECEFHRRSMQINISMHFTVSAANSSELNWINVDNSYHITYWHWTAEF